MKHNNNYSKPYKSNNHTMLTKIIGWIKHFQHLFWILCIVVFLLFLNLTMPPDIGKSFLASLKAQSQVISKVLFICLLSLSIVWAIGRPFDLMFFKLLNKSGNRPIWLDMTMLGVTQLGNFLFALGIFFLLLVSGYRLLAYELLLGVLTLGLVVQFMKVLIRRTRPYDRLKNIRIVGYKDAGHSFPSGHTSQAFFMSSLLLHYYQVTIGIWILLYGVALVVGITRIYVGMHYPRDVMGGAILGTSWGILGVIVNTYVFEYLGI